MISRYERMIARRYLLPGRGEGFIFLVASISLVAVALGVAALIAVMSVMNGFRAELFDRILGLNGHAVIQGYGGRLPGWEELLAEAKATPGVINAEPIVEQPLIGAYKNRAEGVLLRGMRMGDVRELRLIADNVKQGRLDDLELDGNFVAIGARLAETLGVRVGDTISLISPEGQTTPFGTTPRIVPYQIAAIFEVGIFDYDKAFVLMPLDRAQTFLRLGSDVGMITLTTTNADKVDDIVEPLLDKIEGRAILIDWRQMNGVLFEALSVERTVMFVVVGFIILVAVFNILTSLIMLVRAKTRDIAILRTMGASRSAMMRIFVTVGTLIGSAGILLGLVLGFGFLFWRQNIVMGVSKLTGVDLWDPRIRYLTELPAKTDPVVVAAIVLLAFVLSLLATIYPAWKAANTDPVQVLRYE